jgi:hypothetical protein
MNVIPLVRACRWLRNPRRCRSVLHTHGHQMNWYRCHQPSGLHADGAHRAVANPDAHGVRGVNLRWTQDLDQPEGDVHLR